LGFAAAISLEFAMSLGTRLFTWLHGELVGTDRFGNRYYRDKRGAKAKVGAGLSKERRWVLYDGEAEASKVPPMWHAWLHYSVQQPPVEGAEDPARIYGWQKEHLPNLTGTTEAYRPPGSLLAGGQRAPATGDYEPWRPS
jgi:NADH:ubiquinone oxidoreductase subunit